MTRADLITRYIEIIEARANDAGLSLEEICTAMSHKLFNEQLQKQGSCL